MRTVATFTKPEDAHNFRAFLEGSSIDAFVRDENIVGADPLYSNAVGGVRVDVADEDFARARELYSATRVPLTAPAPNPRGKLRIWKVFTVTFLVAFLILAVRADALWSPHMYVLPLIASLVIAAAAAVFVNFSNL